MSNNIYAYQNSLETLSQSYKKFHYQKYIHLKHALHQLYDYKIPYKIFLYYSNLKWVSQNYTSDPLTIIEKLALLNNQLHQIPSLQTLHLHFKLWELGQDPDNTRLLASGLKYLHSINHLSLYLQANELGEDPENLRNLSEGLFSLRHSLKSLHLNLTDNDLEEDTDNMNYLS